MRYFYYKIFSILKKIPTNTTPSYNALLIVVLLQAINLFTIRALLLKYFKILLFPSINNTFLSTALVLFGILFALNYFFLLNNIDGIVEKYDKIKKRERVIKNIMLIIYLVLTFLFMRI